MTTNGSKHTPGPWVVSGIPAQHGDDYVNANGPVPVARVVRSTPEHDANARLIASAPDLLAACEVFEEWLRREDDGFPNAGVVRETPEGEAAWRVWWDENCTLCAKAQTLARAAISRARGLA